MKDRDSKGRFLKGIAHPPEKRFVDIDYCKKRYSEGYSTYEISKKFNVSQKTIENRLKQSRFKLRRRGEHTERTKLKIKQTLIRKGIKPMVINRNAWNKGKPVSEKERLRLKSMRAKQIFPLKDSSIEIKVRNFLEKLKIEYYQHKYMNIKNSYQCDFFIPSMNLVIECDGNYWHKYPIGNEIDHIRTSELIQKGFKVLRIWEFEIKEMNLNKFKEKLNEI
jgi:very-short-patch-repair endonuclease